MILIHLDTLENFAEITHNHICSEAHDSLCSLKNNATNN